MLIPALSIAPRLCRPLACTQVVRPPLQRRSLSWCRLQRSKALALSLASASLARSSSEVTRSVARLSEATASKSKREKRSETVDAPRCVAMRGAMLAAPRFTSFAFLLSSHIILPCRPSARVASLFLSLSSLLFLMEPTHLAPTPSASALTPSPDEPQRCGIFPELKEAVCGLTPAEHQQKHLLSVLEVHECLHAELIRTAISAMDGGSSALIKLFVDWLIQERKILTPAAHVYRGLFVKLFDLISPLPSSRSTTALPSGSRKRGHDGGEHSPPPSDSPKSPCNGKRFPYVEKLNTRHRQFWSYLPVAAALAMDNRPPKYWCVCGKELASVQGYNFARHTKTCAPDLLPPSGEDWPENAAPPAVPPHFPSVDELKKLAELSPQVLAQIPRRWREVIVSLLANDVLASSSVVAPPPSALQPPAASLPSPLQPAAVLPPPLAVPVPAMRFDPPEAQVMNQLPPDSLISAMVGDFCMDQQDLGPG